LILSMKSLIYLTLGLYEQQGVPFDLAQAGEVIEDFIRGRVKAYLLNLDLPLEAIEAVISLPLDDIVDTRRRAEAMAQKLGSAEMLAVLFAVNRCKNLSQHMLGHHIDEKLFKEDAEQMLYQSVFRVENELEKTARNYGASIDILAQLRQPADRFFDEVLVMDPDEAVRNNRIRLLNYCMDLFRSVADFTQISTPAS